MFLFWLGAINLAAEPFSVQIREMLIKHEGLRYEPYQCSQGFWHVGVGHKFLVGDIIKDRYSHIEVMVFLNEDTSRAINGARKIFPSFDKQPPQIQLILVDLTYNLGIKGLSKFVKFRRAIEQSNYLVASQQLTQSKYFKQVGKRSANHVQILSKMSKK